jgi:hypothetical protein
MLPLPRIRITDLLSEVARWTFFTDRFIRLRTVKRSATWSFPRSSIAGPFLFARALRLVQNSHAKISSIFAGPFAMRKAGPFAMRKDAAAD